MIGRAEDTVEGSLGIQRAPSPEDTVLDDAGKGRLVPAFLVHRHHVVVGHHHTGGNVGLAWPPEKQCPIRQLLEDAGTEHTGVQNRQHVDELLKFSVILHGRVVIGNGLAPDQLLQSLHGPVLIKAYRSLIQRRLGLGIEAQRPDDQHRQKDAQ